MEISDLYVLNVDLIWFQLEAVNWRLNLQMAQSNKTKLKSPNALFELQVSDESTEVS